MNLDEKYYHIWSFFVSNFSDRYPGNLTDEEVMDEAKKRDPNKEFLKLVIEEAKKLRAEIDTYWEQIRDEANIYFTNSKETAEWLDKVIRYLEK